MRQGYMRRHLHLSKAVYSRVPWIDDFANDQRVNHATDDPAAQASASSSSGLAA